MKNFKKIEDTNFINAMRLFLFTILVLNISIGHAAEGDQSSDIMKESVLDVSTVAATTLGGAVLGLSTLSFVAEPKEHLKNIVVGGAIGLIIGVVYVAVQKATESQELYMRSADSSYRDAKDFSSSQRFLWAQNDFLKNSASNGGPWPMARYNYSFSF